MQVVFQCDVLNYDNTIFDVLTDDMVESINVFVLSTITFYPKNISPLLSMLIVTISLTSNSTNRKIFSVNITSFHVMEAAIY